MNPLSTGFIIAPAMEGTAARPAQVQALAAKLLTLGILIDPSRLEGATVEQLTAIDEQFAKIEGLSQSKPMYPNFPKGVRESSTLTLFIDQIVHYLSCGTWVPETEPQLRKQLNLKDVLDPRVLQVISTLDEARDAFVELVTRPVSISEDVAAGFYSLIEAFPEIKDEVIGDVVFARNRENMGWALDALALTNEEFVTAIRFMKNHNQLLVALATRYFDTDTINAVKLDVAKSVRTKNINRQVRYAILRTLPQLVIDEKFPADEMLGHKVLWRKILHNIHPTEFDLTKEQQVLIDAVHDKSNYISRAAVTNLPDQYKLYLMTTQKKRLKEHAKELIKAQRSLVEDLIAQRKASRLSQQEVADRMGVSQSAVSLFEHYDSNPTLSSIRRYALAVEADLVLQVKPRLKRVSGSGLRGPDRGPSRTC